MLKAPLQPSNLMSALKQDSHRCGGSIKCYTLIMVQIQSTHCEFRSSVLKPSMAHIAAEVVDH